jgi:hypothetical protein
MDQTNGKWRRIRFEKYFLRPHPFGGPERLSAESGDSLSRNRLISMERMMKRTLIRYRTKPELADQNANLVAAVFEELKWAKPEGVRYVTLRLDDDNFVHFVETAADDGSSALPNLAAFKAFQSGVRERCAEPPLVRGATIVGNYRMLSEP